MYDFLEHHHIVSAFYPVADAFAGGLTTDYVSLAQYRQATLIVATGAIEDANISNLVTVNASDDAAGSNTTAMAFRYRVSLSSTSVDSWSAYTLAAAAGYNFASNNAVANVIWYLTVKADEVSAAQEGASFIAAVIAETADKTITAGGRWILSDPRYPQAQPLTAIV